VPRLLGLAHRLWQPIGTVVWANRRAAHEELLARTRAALGQPAFDVAWSDGLRLSVDDALLVPGRDPSTGENALARLTPREREVAALIAQGLTSRDIAAHLVISERTADVHADNLRTKLGLHSRAEIAAWAVAHRLTT
jgi:non-specific serine/threonine protein kinase